MHKKILIYFNFWYIRDCHNQICKIIIMCGKLFIVILVLLYYCMIIECKKKKDIIIVSKG